MMFARAVPYFKTVSMAALSISAAYLVTRLIASLCAGANETQNMLIVFTSALLTVLLVQWMCKFVRQVQSLPPGPWGMPIIGYLAFMGTEKHTKFMELAKRFGSVYSAKLGFQLTVVLSDHNMIREAFRREEFTGRPDTPFMKTLNGFGEFWIYKIDFEIVNKVQVTIAIFFVYDVYYYFKLKLRLKYFVFFFL